MFFLLPLVGIAVGAVAGACTAHAASEKDRKAAEHHRQVANNLTDKYSTLEKKYNEYAEKSKVDIKDLIKQHALDEVEKDLLRLAIRLQQGMYMLMWDIDARPTRQALINFEEAVTATNQVLRELKEEPIQIPAKYFSRNLTRIKKRESLEESKKKKASQRKSEQQSWHQAEISYSISVD